MYTFVNSANLDESMFKAFLDSLVQASSDHFQFKRPPTIVFDADEQNANNLLGKTAYYDPENDSVTVFTTSRHLKDILRSVSHELVHHAQNCRGEFEIMADLGEGYAQKDDHLREMEKEAYLKGNLIFRDLEDKIKSDEPLKENMFIDTGVDPEGNVQRYRDEQYMPHRQRDKADDPGMGITEQKASYINEYLMEALLKDIGDK